MKPILKLTLIGCAVGCMSAIFGVGGGTLLVPAFILLIKMPPQEAIASSLVAVLPIVVLSLVLHTLLQTTAIAIAPILWLSCGAVLGARLGPKLLLALPSRIIMILFAIFLWFICAQLAGVFPHAAALSQPAATPWMIALGFLAGLASSFFGIGGGLVFVPGMEILFHIPIHTAILTSLWAILPTALMGSWAYKKSGLISKKTWIALLPGAGAGTLLGTFFFKHSSAALLQKSFALLLFLISLQLLAQSRKKPL